jgi:hypothetical protein
MNWYFLLSDEDIPAPETCLCEKCFKGEEAKEYAREMASQSDDVDPDGEFRKYVPNGNQVCCFCDQ